MLIITSARIDICYIENTIEATIKLLHERNLLVRIKVSWALANITDASVTNL